MEWYFILLIVIASVGIFMLLISPFVITYILYLDNMVRTSKEKWGRHCSAPKNEEQVQMWNQGLKMIKSYNPLPVHIVSEGLNLYGEYVDVGAKRCVILLGGRCESLYYAYFYAKPYLENNCNVLVIDTRAHGNSDGKVNTVGFRECNDIINWAKLIHDEYHNEEIYLHGTCIGAATGIHALAKENCPKYIKKIICDGVYPTYYVTFKNHMISEKRPIWPVLNIFFAFIKMKNKIDAKNDGPIKLLDKVTVDIMFISGLEDKYISPEMTKHLYDICASKHKEYHYLPKGKHSHLRINQPERYDALVLQFINKKYE